MEQQENKLLTETRAFYRTGELINNSFGYFGYSGDADPPCPVMLTPHKDYGSENLND
jgi:hypothetical protein